MTASASWRGAMPPVSGSCPATATISQRDFRLPARSFLIDGEAIVTDDRGLAVFDLIRRQRHSGDAVLISFDLIELDGEDLRRTPIEQRKRILAKLARRPHAGIVVNEVFEGDGDILFAHACELGCEGIVSKRLGSSYRSGRSAH
jgi:bifunctional non-homologous end joining protein LigD